MAVNWILVALIEGDYNRAAIAISNRILLRNRRKNLTSLIYGRRKKKIILSSQLAKEVSGKLHPMSWRQAEHSTYMIAVVLTTC